jgi:hypothetical protein
LTASAIPSERRIAVMANDVPEPSC